MSANRLEPGRIAAPRRHATWVTVLFSVLFLVNVAPLVLLGWMGGYSKETWKDPSYPLSFGVVCTASLVALAGLIGARRGWNAIVLSSLGLVMVAWPLFVAYVLLAVMTAAL